MNKHAETQMDIQFMKMVEQILQYMQLQKNGLRLMMKQFVMQNVSQLSEQKNLKYVLTAIQQLFMRDTKICSIRHMLIFQEGQFLLGIIIKHINTTK